jgi:GWxTD domain-containing protein
MKVCTSSQLGLILLLGLVLITAGPIIAQRSNDITVRGGAIFFDRPEFDTVTLVEFPFTLNRSQFEFYRPDSTGAYFARIFAQITLYGEDDLPLDSVNTYFSAVVSRLSDAYQPDYTLFNSLVLILRPGVYSAHLTVIDAVSKKEGRFDYDRIIVDSPTLDALAMGGKCLAYDIRYVGNDPAAAGVGVSKNGYEVRTNPLGTYSVSDTVAFFYGEVYNLDYQADQPSDFQLGFAVLDQAGNVVHQLGTETRPKPGSSAVVVESFDIAGWTPGEYLLQVTVSDSSQKDEVKSEVPIRIIAPVTTAAELVANLGHDRGDYPDLEIQLRLVRYLLTPVEEVALKKLTELGQKTFITQYWQEHDSDPETDVIENRLQIYERYLVANERYSIEEGRTDGWSTDRGRILMIYGQPDQLEDRHHPVDRYPYQVWHYYEHDNGAVCVFVDEDGFGLYRMVHSTVEGELFDKYWDAAVRDGSLSFE